MHGYDVEPGKPPQDVTTLLSPSGAWASGAIVSTPADLGAFVRADLSGRFFGREQLRFVVGSSSPPGPGRNAAGLAIFRYQTRCGTVYGHTGNFPGYVQWAAATADGRRSVTTSLNIAAPNVRDRRRESDQAGPAASHAREKNATVGFDARSAASSRRM
jgi:D-alanyl-D-alanine carboxypeptidase